MAYTRIKRSIDLLQLSLAVLEVLYRTMHQVTSITLSEVRDKLMSPDIGIYCPDGDAEVYEAAQALQNEGMITVNDKRIGSEGYDKGGLLVRLSITRKGTEFNRTLARISDR